MSVPCESVAEVASDETSSEDRPCDTKKVSMNAF